MESMLESFTAELTIQPGPVVDGSAANGFAESVVTLRATRRGALDSGLVDLRWGADVLATGISAATFLDNFWNGHPAAHSDALDFGRLLLRRLLGHPDVRDRWSKIQGWRDARPLRLELILPPADRSPISAVPFELLAGEHSFLFYAGRSALVRCIRDLKPRQATIRPRDRLLVAWANPIDVEPHVDDQVFQQHETSIAEAGRAAHLEVLPAVSRTDRRLLEKTLAAHRPVPVVSLVAHGYRRGGQLAFENADRTSEPVPASNVAAALQMAETQVALLWSCHAARHHADLGSLAERLLHPDGGDLAAVLAAHGAIRADWTPRAAERIFASLTTSAGNDLERAVTHARQALTEQDPQWAVLAYYARPIHGRSVSFEDAGRTAVDAYAVTVPRTDRVESIPSRPRYWVDRPGEIGEIAARVASGRLVTVRGMPGIGKTEVAREAAERMVQDPAFAFEAALWIALDDLRTVDDLRERIAAWAGLSESDVPDWRLTKAIGARRALWILDNAEDLTRTDGAGLRSFLGGILETCPGIKLLVTSQRPTGDLRSEREATYVVRRIDDPAACRQLFANAAGSPLGDRLHSAEIGVLLELLDGHPRSLVLVAGQIQDGGANLASILARLRVNGDEAVLAAELLESGTDWSDHDRLRAERLVSSLHIAYWPLLEHAPGAAELFAWLGVLPAGLPVTLASAIFGDDAPERIATLNRFSLVEFRGADERLELPAPVRWYAEHRLDADVSARRQSELLARTLDAIAALMAAAYDRLGKPGFSAVVESSRREALNLEFLLRRLERIPGAPGLARRVARAFGRWSEVRIFGGHNAQQVTLIERAWTFVTALEEAGKDYASLAEALGDLYMRTAQLAEAEAAYRTALTAFAAIHERLGEANTLRALGDLYMRTARLTEAEETYGRALAAFATIDERLGEANTLRALGDVHLRMDRSAEAEEAYRKALVAFATVDDRLGETNTFLGLGNLYLDMDRLAEAEEAYRKALAAFVAMDERLGEANTRKALGDVYLRTNRLAEAEDSYRTALTAFAAMDERLGEANTRKALGNLYLRTDRLAEAEDAYQKALKVFVAIGERLGEADTRRALGDFYLRRAQLAEAEEEYRRALAAFVATGARLGEANTISSLGNLALAGGRPAEAFEQFRSARERHLAIDSRLGAAGQLGYMARAAQSAHLTDRAIVLGGMARQELSALDDRFGVILAGQDLIGAAQQADNAQLTRNAIILTWHYARDIEALVATQLAPFVTDLLPPSKIEAGIDPDEVNALEGALASAIIEVANRLEATGEDPLGPLPPTPPLEAP